MAYKCNQCGKFISATKGAKCSKCSLRYHRPCVNISPDTRISSKWQCQECKVNKTTKLCTPVKSSEDSPSFIVNEAGSETVILTDNTSTLIYEIRMLRQEMATVSREMNSFREELSRLNTTVDDLNKRTSSIETRLTNLEQCKDEDKNITGSSADLISNLRNELNERDQTFLLNDIEVSGLIEKPGENLISIMNLIGNKIGVHIDERDIVSAERSGPRHLQGDKPRKIVVRLSRRSVRDDVLRAVRVRRNIDSTGMVDGTARRFYINEHLTSINRRLLYKAREEGKIRSWRYVWTKGGKVFARRAPDTPVHRIRSDCDIAKLFSGHTI